MSEEGLGFAAPCGEATRAAIRLVPMEISAQQTAPAWGERQVPRPAPPSPTRWKAAAEKEGGQALEDLAAFIRKPSP
jgi:hypothetical protein